MSKGNRNKAKREVEKKQALEKNSKKLFRAHRKQNKPGDNGGKLNVAALVIAVVCFVIIGALVFIIAQEIIDSGNTVSEQVSRPPSSDAESAAVYTLNRTVTRRMVSYFYNSGVNSFFNTYADELDDYGLDPSKPLKEQEFTASEEYSTWHDYFIKNCVENLKQMSVLAEAAAENNILLTQADYDRIESELAQIKDEADEYSRTYINYIAAMYGSDVDEDTLVNCCELQILASKFYTHLYKSFKYSKSDYVEYINENPDDFLYCDYISYTVTAKVAEDDTSAQIAEANAEASAFAKKLAECKTEQAFKAELRQYLSGSFTGFTEEQIEESLDTYVIKKYKRTDTEFGEWAYTPTTSAGSALTIASENQYTVYLMLNPRYTDNSVTKNVRHIFISSGESTIEEAKLKAEELLDRYESGDKTEDSFATLAKTESDSDGADDDGGLLENISEGYMVESFDEWCFDESRSEGDVGIVESSYGCHVIYYIGDGLAKWEADADAAMRQSDYEKAYDAYAEKYNVVVVQSVINDVQ